MHFRMYNYELRIDIGQRRDVLRINSVCVCIYKTATTQRNEFLELCSFHYTPTYTVRSVFRRLKTLIPVILKSTAFGSQTFVYSIIVYLINSLEGSSLSTGCHTSHTPYLSIALYVKSVAIKTCHLNIQREE